MHNGKTPVRLPVPQGLRGLYSYLKYLLKTVHFFSAVQLRNRRGMGLVEVLLAAGLSVLVFSGTHKALMLSVKTSRVVTSELAERELKQAVGMALGEEASCKANLIPRADLPSTIPESPNKGLYGTKTTRDSGAGEVLNLDAGTVSLRRGFEIKGDLRIVKMELRQWDKTPADPDKRVFVVWYEKLHLGPAEEGKSCTAGSQASDQDGCYFSRCELKYKLNTAKDGAETCQIVGGDCAGVSVAGGGGGGAECYEIDKTGAEGGKILIGCGRGGQDGIGTTAIGFEAGKVNTGASNIFIGLQAGKENTSGQSNTFIGSRTGEKNKTGESNVFIGDYAGQLSTSSENIFIGGSAGTNSKGAKNTFIGVQSGQQATTGAKNVFIGYQAGSKTTTGTNNVFIGHQAGTKATTGANNIAIGADVEDATKNNQINIGNIIKAKPEGTGQAQTGVIELCNAQGDNCIKLSKDALTCGDGEYFRGFKEEEGELVKDCQPDIQCPTGFFFGPGLGEEMETIGVIIANIPARLKPMVFVNVA